MGTRLFAFALGLSLFGETAWAAPLLRENFDKAGPLANSSPAVGNAWQAAGGAGVLLKTGGALRIGPMVSQEVESLFPAVSAGAIYAGLSITVTAAPTTPWILPFTFRGTNASGGNQLGRIFISTGTSSGHYRVGIENNLDQPVWWPTELEATTSYRLVIAFTENGAADVTQLWVNPTAAGDTSISEVPEAITGGIFGVRLNAFIGSSGTMQIDELVVTQSFAEAAATPVPTPVATPSVTPVPSLEARIAKCLRQLTALKTKLVKAKRLEDPTARRAAVQQVRQKIRMLKQRLAQYRAS